MTGHTILNVTDKFGQDPSAWHYCLEPQLPKGAGAVLKMLKSLYPEAIIAGGALREPLSYGFVKDLDFYIAAEDDKALNKMAFDLKDRGALWAEVNTNAYRAQSYVRGVIDFAHPEAPYRCQLVETTVPPILAVVEYFDAENSRLWFDGAACYATQSAIDAINAQQIRAVVPAKYIGKAAKYCQKLVNRSGWPAIISSAKGTAA